MSLALGETCFKKYVDFIHELTGITISSSRISMVEGRLRKRVTALGIQDYEDYLNVLKRDRTEQACFIDLITTNETYFFRTPRIWDYIENTYIPKWHTENPGKTFTAWSAAASSGEEAHSLGVICQNYKDKNPSFKYRIVGTDISQEMVHLCKQANYTGKAIDSFKKNRTDLFSKYMTPLKEETYKPSQMICANIQFTTHNLFTDFKHPQLFDLILIRNVLIYFTGNDQEKVLSLIAPKLEKNGVLIIGESESLAHISTPFKSISPLVYSLDSESHLLKKVG